MKSTLSNLFPLLLFCIFWNTIASAQIVSRSSVDAAGQTLTKQGITLSYVIGEAIGDLLSNPGAEKYLTTGFVQPDIEVSQVLAGSAKSLAVYPNPASGGIVKLAFNHVPDGSYTVNIYDAKGKLIQTQQVNYTSQNLFYLPLDVSHFAGGAYFIQVVNPVKFSGEVKLIKY
jgi:hypothetical protein